MRSQKPLRNGSERARSRAADEREYSRTEKADAGFRSSTSHGIRAHVRTSYLRAFCQQAGNSSLGQNGKVTGLTTCFFRDCFCLLFHSL